MYDINRNALILIPTKLLYDWANQIFPDDPLEEQSLLEHDQANIYLIPEFETIEEALEWVEENYEYFLVQELAEWTEDERRWPQDTSWEMFRKWFHISIQSVVMDCLEEPLLRD